MASDDRHRSVSASASAIVAGTASGYHELRIQGYSRTKSALPNGNHILSRPFRVAGHTWAIRYFPNGDCLETTADYISLYLVLKDATTEGVMAQYGFSFVDEVEKQKPSYLANRPLRRFVANHNDKGEWGYREFIKSATLERSGRINDDCLMVRCDITVPKELTTEDAVVPGAPFVVVLPADWLEHFHALLLGGKGADVKFLVLGETFVVHRCVLAARSSVFDALLFGPMKEGTATESCIRIDDMLPQVFQSLLHFIYTDSLPEVKGQDEDYSAMMAQHLLEAADRYDLQMLKLICEDRLCKHIDVTTVATTLELAEQHGCQGLKEACFEFLKSLGVAHPGQQPREGSSTASLLLLLLFILSLFVILYLLSI